MPPRAKGKANAKGAAKPAVATERVAVPRPPPTPVLVRFPEALEEQLEAAPARCVLLAWRDRENHYKLEVRAYSGEDKDPELGWEDPEQPQPRPLGGRSDVFLVSGLQSARVEFRLAVKNPEKLDDKYVANWFSAPSDPCFSAVDPPSVPSAELVTGGDYGSLGAILRFGPTNASARPTNEHEAAGWPGLGICRAQARWRMLRQVAMDNIQVQGEEPDSPRLLPGVLEGKKQRSPPGEVGCTSNPFNAEAGTWSFRVSDMPSGLLVRFEVRVGTIYRWSAWSEESEDLLTVVPPPEPEEGGVGVVSTSDSTAKLRWLPFRLTEGLNLCEYRVMVCQLPTAVEDRESPLWDDRTAHVAGIFTAATGERPVDFRVSGLMADMHYVVRVEARYPFVGARTWSSPAVTQDPLHTRFALRPPPLAPLALPVAEVEALLPEGQGLPFPEGQPWLVLMVESSAMGDYRLEFASVPSETGKGGERPLKWNPAAKVEVLGIPQTGRAWTALAALLSENSSGNWPAVVCRLRHRFPSSVPPHLGAGSTSAQLVPVVAPPAHCLAEVRWCSKHQCFGMLLRFYLGSRHPTERKDNAVDATTALRKASRAETGPATNLVRTGHCYVTTVQASIQCIHDEGEDETEGSASWVLLPPQPLPAPCDRCCSNTSLGALLEGEDPPISAAALAFDAGARHEVWLWSGQSAGLGACLTLGEAYRVRLRVGTAVRWSPWEQIPGEVCFTTPAPIPLSVRGKDDQPVRPECTMCSPTTAVLRFPPFVLAAAVPSVEYVITATPRFGGHADEDQSSAPELGFSAGRRHSAGRGVTGDWRQSTSRLRSSNNVPIIEEDSAEKRNALGEGAVVVRKSMLVRVSPARTDEEAVRQLDEKGGLIQLCELSATQAQSQLRVLLQRQADAEVDSCSRVQSKWVRAELPGLLPATEYEVAVVARYPGVPAAPFSEALKEVAETPCGAAAPVAPVALAASLGEIAQVGSSSREVTLELEDRPGYVLQCAGVSLSAGGGWYPAEDPASEQQASRWWPDGRGKAASTGEWASVSFRRVDVEPLRSGFTSVVAELPGFTGAASPARASAELADFLRFRLCIETRRGSHACRWVGDASEPIAVCIAPVTAAPMPKCVFADNSWHVTVCFFTHSASRPQSTTPVGRARVGLSLDSTFAELLDARQPSAVVPRNEEKELEGLDAPIGYGHRSVRWAQLRVQHVGGASHTPGAPERWLQLPEVPLSQCREQAPRLTRCDPASLEKAGDLHALLLRGDDERLCHGGVYRVQVRLGSGYRWSPWSLSSRLFEFGVPKPEPVKGPLQVNTLSASIVQLRWAQFVLPTGLTEARYLLRAEPTTLGPRGAQPVEAVRILPASTPDNVLEAELPNVLPATEYVFSVRASYPHIGQSSWGEALVSAPQALDDTIADWVGLPAPAVLPCGGPRPFARAEGGLPLFSPSDRALLVAFPDTSCAPGGTAYRLEYRHTGSSPDSAAAGVAPDDTSATWSTPLEVVRLDLSREAQEEAFLSSCCSQWKQPPQLWRVLLPAVPSAGRTGAALAAAEGLPIAHLQRVQLRLAAESRGECAVTRWFSATSTPLCAGMAPPVKAKAALQIADEDLTLRVSFILDKCLTPDPRQQFRSENPRSSAQPCALNSDEFEHSLRAGSPEGPSVPQQLPRGFCHAFVTCFQVRSRTSPRPPGPDPHEAAKRASGIPWSSWVDSPDAGLQAAVLERAEGEGDTAVQHSTFLLLPQGKRLEHGSWYQVSVRVSDGVCWSAWSEPSAPVKVYVAPPKPLRPDTEELSVVRDQGGNNLRLRWSLLRASGGLRLVEYALYVCEVLQDGTEICSRQIAALVQGQAAKVGLEHEGEEEESMCAELRDLRQDVNYVFTLAARYPHVGSRDFEVALSSARTSLRVASTPLPVPMQVPLPLERLRRMQLSRYVLVRWSLVGLPPGEASQHQLEAPWLEQDNRYDLQALAEDGGDGDWVACTNVGRMKVDGVLAWLVKDIPSGSLRNRFRLWDRDTGRFGRSSPLMVSFMEPITKLGAARFASESSVQIILKAPLDAPHLSHDFVCRYQIRCRPDKLEAEWTEMPVHMLWHRQNDHIDAPDAPVDSHGAVFSGLEAESGNQSGGGEGDAPGVADALPVSPGFPTLPLAHVSPWGEVRRQRCIVATVCEEDGLQPESCYVFCLRVGDLFRMSDWGPESTPVLFGVPPPVLSPDLRPEETRLQLSDVTSTTLCAAWAQFVPAAGVPLHVEVEYLLSVTLMKPRDLLGRSHALDDPLPHSQWFLSSTLPEGTLPEDVGHGKRLGVLVSGLSPRGGYDLKLGVRYARLGSRRWTKALTASVTTKQPEITTTRQQSGHGPDTADMKALASARSPPSARAPPSARTPGSARDVASAENARVPESPRRLPPLESAQPREKDAVVNLVTAPQPTDVEEWTAAAQSDAARVASGARRQGALLGATDGEVGYPPRPPDFVSFWRRDPMDGRPSMPAMPSAGPSARLLDPTGRDADQTRGGGQGSLPVPAPRASSRESARVSRPAEERTAYPRRYLFDA